MTRSRLRARLLAALAALALITSACGGGTDSSVATQSDADAAAEESSAPAEAESADEPAAPAISLVASTVGGGQIDFGSLEGQDVVLWFWAPW